MEESREKLICSACSVSLLSLCFIGRHSSEETINSSPFCLYLPQCLHSLQPQMLLMLLPHLRRAIFRGLRDATGGPFFVGGPLGGGAPFLLLLSRL